MSLLIHQVKSCYISKHSSTERNFCPHQYLRRDLEQIGQSLRYFWRTQWHLDEFPSDYLDLTLSLSVLIFRASNYIALHNLIAGPSSRAV